MTYTLYHATGSRSARVLWLLDELSLPTKLVQMTLPELLADRDFRQISPVGRVPYLIDAAGGRMESLAILQILLERHDPEGRLAPLPGELERDDFLEWLAFSETMGCHVMNLNQQTNVIQPPEARSAVTIKLESRRLQKTLEAVERRLDGRDFILDRGFSAVDIAIGWSVHAAFGFVPSEPYPLTAAWLGRVSGRPGARRALSGSMIEATLGP